MRPHPEPPPAGETAYNISALIFDFDGLIVDTEGPIFRVWQRIYREYRQVLPLERWLTIVGTASGGFDPVAELSDLTGERLDREEFDALGRLYYKEATATQQLLPGVNQYLEDARQLRLKAAIASSSSRKWVTEHLERFGIGDHFDAIVCRDDVMRTKPDPQLYEAALRRLDVRPDEAVALEDSSHGVRAAKAAGIFCVAIPNPLTASLDLTEADLRLSSLEAMPLPRLLEQLRR